MPTKTDLRRSSYQLRDIVTLTYSLSWQHARNALVMAIHKLELPKCEASSLSTRLQLGRSPCMILFNPQASPLMTQRTCLNFHQTRMSRRMKQPLKVMDLRERTQHLCLFDIKNTQKKKMEETLSTIFSLELISLSLSQMCK